MKIKLSPVFKESEPIHASVQLDTITVNGVTYDFSSLEDGGSLKGDETPEVFVGDVSRINGDINITLLLPHSVDAPLETRFPAAFHDAMTVNFGIVPIPPYGG